MQRRERSRTRGRPSKRRRSRSGLEKTGHRYTARELHGRTPFATPVPVVIGEPGSDFPLPWSVQTWLPGKTAVEVDPGDSLEFAHDLADFIRAVRAMDLRGRTFSGPGRGGALHTHDAWVQTCLRASVELFEVAQLERLWRSMRELPRPGVDAMTHGDLIPGNVIVEGGRLTAVIDVGGLGPADPALDLVAAWHLLEEAPRQALRRDLGCDDAEWQRGKAWALEQALGVAWYYLDSNPVMSVMGQRTIERILTD